MPVEKEVIFLLDRFLGCRSRRNEKESLNSIPECGIFTRKKMARNTSVILGEHFDNFIKSELETGRYGSASEVIRSGLRLLEDERKKISAINEALIIGEESGSARPFDNEKFKLEMRKSLEEDA